MRVSRFFVVCVTAMALGCATGGHAQVTASKRAEDAPPSPERIYVLTRSLDADGNRNLGLEFQKAIEGRLSAGLARCGVVTGGRIMGKVELEQEIEKPLVAFRPDAVLFLRRTYVLYSDASVVRETYEVSLVAGPKSKEAITWWKASVTNTPGSQLLEGTKVRSAETLVDQVLARMKLDGFFPGCPAPGPNELPSALQKVPATAYVATTNLKVAGAITVGEVSYPSARRNAEAEAREASVRRASGSSNDAAPPDRASAPMSAILAESLAMPDQLRAPTARFGRATYQPSLEVYVQTALSAELGKMGLAAAAPRTLRVEIEDASLDLSGWGYGASLKLKYEVLETATGKVLHAASRTTATSARERTASEAAAWNRVIARAAEALALDLEAAKAI